MAFSITSDDIEAWAARVDAAAVLPELVRRLILATARLRSIEFRSAGGVRFAGWDGVVLCTQSDGPFCPEGLSHWELSTDAGVKKKAQKDYGKRTPNDEATYVAVTARKFADKEAWTAERRQTRAWGDVRVVDADDLATWLSEAPAVAAWFASMHLRRPVEDIWTGEEFLQAWCNRTSPPLPPTLLMLGRERARASERVGEWLAGEPSRLVVAGDSRDDALRFVVAAISGGPAGSGVAERVLIVRTERALRWAQQEKRPLVLIPTFDATALLTSSRHYVVLTADRDGRSRPDVDVGRVPHSLLQRELEQHEFGKAAELAVESQGALGALARLLGAPIAPEWAREPTRAMLALLLLGEWAPSSANDMELATRLTGGSRADVEQLCAQLSTCPDAPIRRHQGSFGSVVWKWSSPKDAWSALAPRLTDSLLDDFLAVAGEVLGEENPVYTLAKDERFHAPLHGKVLRYSKALREGVSSSMARLSLMDDNLRGATMRSGQGVATALVRSLLRPGWIAWASLADVLPIIAESAPEAFLDQAVTSINHGEDGVFHLFREEGDALFGKHPHTGLLWALECLAWSPDRMPRVVRLLAQLAERDPGGGISNRPARSLVEIFNPFRPSTKAALEQRIRSLENLHEASPRAAWELCMTLGRFLRGGYSSSTQRPRFLPETFDERLVSDGEYLAFGKAVAQMLVIHAGSSTARWAELVECRRSLLTVGVQALPVLRERIANGMADDQGTLRAAVRRALHLALLKEPRDGDADVANLVALYELLTPQDPVDAVAWLFVLPAPLPEHLPGGWREEADRLTRYQKTALLRVYEAGGDSALARLIREGTDDSQVGVLLAQSSFASEIEGVVLAIDTSKWARARAGFFAVRAQERGNDWARSYLISLVDANLVDQAVQAARHRPWTPETWDMIAAVGGGLREAYWRSRPSMYPQDTKDTERFVQELVTAGAFAQAFDVAGHSVAHVSSGLILRVLDGLSKTPDDVSNIAKSGSAGWCAQEIFTKLAADDQVEDDALAALELRYLQWLDDPEPPPTLRIFRALEDQPELFAQLVSMIFMPDEEVDREAVQIPDESTQLAAQGAYETLSAWHGYPSRRGPLDERVGAIAAWVGRVLELTAADGRLNAGLGALGAVLARVPSGADGAWPCEAARKLIEDGKIRFRRALSTAKRNMRGMVTKAVFEGGRQEHEIAQRFRADAGIVRGTGAWPATAAFLDELAGYYEAAGRSEDQSARDGRLEEGLDENERG